MAMRTDDGDGGALGRRDDGDKGGGGGESCGTRLGARPDSGLRILLAKVGEAANALCI